MSFKFYKQYDGMDCGPACLRMIAKYYGRNYKQQTLGKLCEINRNGASLLGISDAAEKIGFRTIGVKINAEQLKKAELPCILHWRQYHFVVLCKIEGNKYHLADPATGLITIDEKHFNDSWLADKETGIALILTPTPKFYELENETNEKVRWGFLFRYLVAYRKLVLQLVIGLGIGSMLQLITPFLTQGVVDIGINTRNISFITIILMAQIALIIGRIYRY
jgi:ATP-binding cassette subfamily B protein